MFDSSRVTEGLHVYLKNLMCVDDTFKAHDRLSRLTKVMYAEHGVKYSDLNIRDDSNEVYVTSIMQLVGYGGSNVKSFINSLSARGRDNLKRFVYVVRYKDELSDIVSRFYCVEGASC